MKFFKKTIEFLLEICNNIIDYIYLYKGEIKFGLQKISRPSVPKRKIHKRAVRRKISAEKSA